MARPKKKGLSYFPLDTQLMGNRKIQRLYQKYGPTGLCIYLTLLCEIYRTEGYYIPCSKELSFDLAFTLGLEEELIEAVILYSVEIRLFDRQLMQSKKVLTSEGIQSRYTEVRKRVRLTFEISPGLEAEENESSDKTGVSSEKTRVSSDKTGIFHEETPLIHEETPTKEKENKNKLLNQIETNQSKLIQSKPNQILQNENKSKENDRERSKCTQQIGQVISGLPYGKTDQ